MRAHIVVTLLLVALVVVTVASVHGWADVRVPAVAGETSGPFNPNEPDGNGGGA
jgi:hypothetical protein